MHVTRNLLVAALVLGPRLAAAILPSTPTGAVATAVSCTQVSIVWNASTPGDLPFYGYKLYRDGVRPGGYAH